MEKIERDQLIIQIKDWGKHLSEHHLPKYPDRHQMAEFVLMCGGNLEAVKGHEKSMKKWTVAGMAEAMEAVWSEKWEEVQNWNEDWIKDYEDKTGRTLPHINIYKKGSKRQVVARVTKQSPMKHFLGLITRWAAFNDEQDPEFNEKRFFDEINVRVSNGLLRQQGAERITGSIQRPDTSEIYHPSLPPEYPLALIEHLISLKK